MTRRRKSNKTLTGTRIFIRNKKYCYFSPEPILNKRNGMLTKWHTLSPVSDGEYKARVILNEMLGSIAILASSGTFVAYFRDWAAEFMMSRQESAPTDPERLKMWVTQSRNYQSQFGVIEKSFVNIDVSNVSRKEIRDFLNHWKGRRSAQVYRSIIYRFLNWCLDEDLISVNPVIGINVRPPKKRDILITNEQFNSIKRCLRVGSDGKPTRTGEMVCCYMDLLYLCYQRGTDIRLLRWSDVDEERKIICFNPTKTRNTTNGAVVIKITDEINSVLARARKCGHPHSKYVIHQSSGEPYAANGLSTLFRRACVRAGVSGVTLKDIRPMAATAAQGAGFSKEEIRIGLVHSDLKTTEGYIRRQETPVSQIVLTLPRDCEEN